MSANRTTPPYFAIISNMCIEVFKKDGASVSFSSSKGITHFFHEFGVYSALAFGRRIPVWNIGSGLTTSTLPCTLFILDRSIHQRFRITNATSMEYRLASAISSCSFPMSDAVPIHLFRCVVGATWGLPLRIAGAGDYCEYFGRIPLPVIKITS